MFFVLFLFLFVCGLSGPYLKTPLITCLPVFFVYRQLDTWVPGMTPTFALIDFPFPFIQSALSL